jgi:hypothetical protein
VLVFVPMLKFAVDKPDAHLVFCGLSQGNVSRLRAGEAIVFDAETVGLDLGKVVIAHDTDPGVPVLRAERPEWVRELIVLSDEDLRDLGGELLEIPLSRRSDGKQCRSLLFSGTTEEAMLADLVRAGIVTPQTRIDAPPGHAGLPTKSESKVRAFLTDVAAVIVILAVSTLLLRYYL